MRIQEQYHVKSSYWLIFRILSRLKRIWRVWCCCIIVMKVDTHSIFRQRCDCILLLLVECKSSTDASFISFLGTIKLKPANFSFSDIFLWLEQLEMNSIWIRQILWIINSSNYLPFCSITHPQLNKKLKLVKSQKWLSSNEHVKLISYLDRTVKFNLKHERPRFKCDFELLLD